METLSSNSVVPSTDKQSLYTQLASAHWIAVFAGLYTRQKWQQAYLPDPADKKMRVRFLRKEDNPAQMFMEITIDAKTGNRIKPPRPLQCLSPGCGEIAESVHIPHRIGKDTAPEPRPDDKIYYETDHYCTKCEREAYEKALASTRIRA